MSPNTPIRRVLAPRTNRSSVDKLFKAQTKYFLNDEVDTQQWEATSEHDPALPPPSSSRTSTWVSQRRESKRRRYEEEEAEKFLEETNRPRVPISPELTAPADVTRGRSPRPAGFEDLPKLDDLLDETCNHPEYPHDLDISLTQERNEEFDFSTAVAIDSVEELGRKITRAGTEIETGAHTVDMSRLHRAVEGLTEDCEGLRKAVSRLQSKVYAAGSGR